MAQPARGDGHGDGETAKCGAEERQEGREGGKEKKDNLEAAEEDAHCSRETGREGGEAEASEELRNVIWRQMLRTTDLFG
jgi:hypothetical protein